jgi:hypothetical protein
MGRPFPNCCSLALRRLVAVPRAAYQRWRRLLAFTRLSRTAVCELSATLGPYDYHDAPDDTNAAPWFFGELRCTRCGKAFRI